MRVTIENLVIDFIQNYKNSHNCRTVWEESVIGLANASDPLFLELKKTVNKSHKLPKELLSQAKTIVRTLVRT